MAKRLTILSKNYSDGFKPLGACVHSAETPLRAGYAESLATNWFARLAPTSAHIIVDPAAIVKMVNYDKVAWHCGAGNSVLFGDEQAGYARFSEEEWLTEAGVLQMDNLALVIREQLESINSPLKVSSEAEARRGRELGKPFGIITHNTARLAFGGTTHTDPGKGYPVELLLDKVKNVTSPATGTPAFPPAKEYDDMAKIIRNNGNGNCYIVKEFGYKLIQDVKELERLMAVYGPFTDLRPEVALAVMKDAQDGGKQLAALIK